MVITCKRKFNSINIHDPLIIDQQHDPLIIVIIGSEKRNRVEEPNSHNISIIITKASNMCDPTLCYQLDVQLASVKND